MLTDFHSHILPGVDDGSRSVEQSLQMLRTEADQGITRIVATPHFYAKHDDPDRFVRRRDAAAEKLLQAMAEHPELPDVVLGAEVHYFPGISESEHLSKLTIQGTNCVLIEMPQPPWSEKMYRELEEIFSLQGLTPIIAHIDRYIRPFGTYRIPQRLERLPVLVQANAEFFLEQATARFAMRLLRADRIHLLGSDCHNMTDRAPNLGDAIKRISQKLGKDCLEQLRAYEQQVFGLEESI